MWRTSAGAVRIGMGCMRLSTSRDRDEAGAICVLHAALDAGVTFLDTADAYCWDEHDAGHNERLIAQALATWTDDRSRVLVGTKGGLTRPQGAWVPDGRARHLAAACEASLRALNVERIALYQLHAPDPRVPLSTSVRALASLQRDGLVDAIGLSNVHVGQIEEARRLVEIASVQVELSLWSDESLLSGVADYCATHGIALLAYRPLGGPQRRRKVLADPVLTQLAARHGATPFEIALAWLRDLGGLVIPIPGATRVETAHSSARAAVLALALTDDDRARLDDRFPASRALRARSGRMPSGSMGIMPAKRDALHSALHDASGESVDARRARQGAPRNETCDATPAAPDDAPNAVANGARDDAPNSASDGALQEASNPAPGGALATVPATVSVERREVVLIMGIPGAGKSRLAQTFVADGYVRLNRDAIGGTLAGLLPALDSALASGASRIVLDNTYISRASRAGVIQTAAQRGCRVRCVWLATTVEEAQMNAVWRMVSHHGRLLAAPEIKKANAKGARSKDGSGKGRSAKDGSAEGSSAKERSSSDAVAFTPMVQFRHQRELEPPDASEGFSQIEIRPFERQRDPSFVHRAVLVWCDGVLVRSRSGQRTPSSAGDVDVMAQRGEVLRRYHADGWKVLGLSWQPEIAGETRSSADVDALFARVQALLGVPIEVEYCPHAAGPPICWCRKPLPGLGVLFILRHRLDPSQCVYVGAGPQDPGFARRLGMPYRDAAAFFSPDGGA